jgi:hypothetical protein
MISYSNSERIHWNYYIALEADLEKVSRYIEFSVENEKTYSIELARLLMTASSEVDVVLKMLCGIKQNRASNITEYHKCISENYPELITEEIFLNRFSMKMQPWINWQNIENNPDWWKSYNNVKHERNNNYFDANLKNTINSVGALLIVLLYYYKNKTNCSFKDTTRALQPDSSLIQLKDEYYYSFMIG